MEYFQLLQLNREPFSNSPDPEFFFESAVHLQCLQQLEVALRLKRGLSVVLGRVGTGKTTICRQLLRRCGHDPAVEVHLVMDPTFDSPRQLLDHLARLMGVGGEERAGERLSPRLLKERIKEHLFRQGVEKGRITLLVIDEGQKLEEESLELLRELLNYETNESKLLQIIIFAQEEFAERLAAKPNFQDRINLLYRLRPLSFAETRAMIGFRLSLAHPEGLPPVAFSFPALWLIHRATGGYPRRIVNLCHKVILALIVQGRIRAGWRVVRFVLKGEGWVSPASGRRPVLAALALVLLLALGAFYCYPLFREAEAVVGQPTSAAATPVPVPEPVLELPLRLALEFTGSEELGEIVILEGETLGGLLARLAGSERPGRLAPLLERTMALNPGLSDPDRIMVGQVLRLPAPGPEFAPAPGYWLKLALRPDLAAAFAFLRRHQGELPLRLALARDGGQGLVYLVLLNRHFGSLSEAGAAGEVLRQSTALSAEIVRVAADPGPAPRTDGI
ncbi:MAG TPA: hypothetical protein ENN98_01405 [Desulfurivibrio alkaliphilus]|uniref:AAA+ ATPase domain-containing protein n=1 Tax=Desulfurivibrio alkaliphilus TaxID=427923 RepID=A0A7C2THV2_9BACT|nr:hypothetical protein [Desulfurivibrio alkaliphilus]